MSTRTEFDLHAIGITDSLYPKSLAQRLGDDAPSCVYALGNLEILQFPKTAFLCSTRCPGDKILLAMDTAKRWREEGRCVISGFHSAVEKECLRIVLRGGSPVIVCPARGLAGMRLGRACEPAMEAGRMLWLSPFISKIRRPTMALAQQRNEFVVALAEDVFIPWATPGGRLEQIRTACRMAS